MEDKKMIEAIVRVLSRKNLMFMAVTNDAAEYNPENGLFHRDFYLGFREFFRPGETRLGTVCDEIRDEYNRLTAYDMEVKNTEDGVEVKTT